MARNSRSEAIAKRKCRSGREADGTEQFTHLIGSVPTRRRKVVRILTQDLAHTRTTPLTVFGRR